MWTAGILYHVALVNSRDAVPCCTMLYTVGIDVDTRAYFTSATIIITVQRRIKIFRWLATIYGTRITYRAACLSALRFVIPIHIRRSHRSSPSKLGRNNILLYLHTPLLSGINCSELVAISSPITGSRDWHATTCSQNIVKVGLKAVLHRKVLQCVW